MINPRYKNMFFYLTVSIATLSCIKIETAATPISVKRPTRTKNLFFMKNEDVTKATPAPTVTSTENALPAQEASSPNNTPNIAPATASTNSTTVQGKIEEPAAKPATPLLAAIPEKTDNALSTPGATAETPSITPTESENKPATLTEPALLSSLATPLTTPTPANTVAVATDVNTPTPLAITTTPAASTEEKSIVEPSNLFSLKSLDNNVSSTPTTEPTEPITQPEIIPNNLMTPQGTPDTTTQSDAPATPELEISNPVTGTTPQEQTPVIPEATITHDILNDTTEDHEENEADESTSEVQNTDNDSEETEEENNDQTEIDSDTTATQKCKTITIINNTGELVTIYGNSAIAEHQEIAEHVGPLAQILLPDDIEQIYVQEEAEEQMGQENININYEKISETLDIDQNLINTSDLESILLIQKRINIDDDQGYLELSTIAPEMQCGALVYNTTSTEQIVKATFPESSSWFSTPKVYFRIPAMSAQTITFPMVNPHHTCSIINFGLVNSKKPLIINPLSETCARQTICCIYSTQDGDFMDDVTEQLA